MRRPSQLCCAVLCVDATRLTSPAMACYGRHVAAESTACSTRQPRRRGDARGRRNAVIRPRPLVDERLATFRFRARSRAPGPSSRDGRAWAAGAGPLAGIARGNCAVVVRVRLLTQPVRREHLRSRGPALSAVQFDDAATMDEPISAPPIALPVRRSPLTSAGAEANAVTRW